LISADNAARKQRRHGRGRPFQPGRSGNPAGKAKGTRNRATVLLEAISVADLEAVLAKVIKMAKAGDLVAIRLILDRVLPPPKNRAVSIELPAIGEWDGNETVLRAYREILDGVANGDISPEEALQLVSLVEAQRAVVRDLQPGALYPKPTAKQLAEAKLQNEKIAKMVKPMWEF
jgi:hypothetical protein